jgi:hypothetical protein
LDSLCQTGRLREQARSHIGIECRQQEIGRLADRHREQAHSYSWNEYICKKQVGCQAAFASRLTPTEKQKQKQGSSHLASLLLFTTQQDER